MKIHKSALVSKKSKIGKGTTIGPYAIISDDVIIGANSTVAAHAVILPYTTMGKNNIVGEHCVIGGLPQDLSFDNKRSFLTIGDDNTIREFSSIHRGSRKGKVTLIGHKNYFMSYSHVAHDCQIGSNVVVTNSVNLGGHAVIEDYAIIGGMVGIHQFVRIGSYAMIGGMSRITKDVIPYALCEGNPPVLAGVNSIGLRRAKMDSKKIKLIREAYRKLFFSKEPMSEVLGRLKKDSQSSKEVKAIIKFISQSKRGVITRNKEISNSRLAH